jgi:hypothetical protein
MKGIYSIGDIIEVCEHDGLHEYTIEKILWREKGMEGKANTWYEKDHVLSEAAEWCIFLYEEGNWTDGIPHGAKLKYAGK